ncbi:hypothetical protein F4802DRAFT_271359 [Xylaria palmicola]|nr:hypothetical protein F4802DRAFT_271359 [Xylaria palmicola]
MSPKRNGDIRGFFKSAGPSGSGVQNQPSSSPPSLPGVRPPLDLPSSPRTPQKPARRVFGHDEEIKGSDDSDDDSDNDSDDSLGSITDALGYRSGPAAHQRDPNVLSTPQAKRIASGIHRSPLTLQPKKHKFDLKALISHSREIERAEESSRKAEALIAQTAGHDSDHSDDSDAVNDPKRLEDAARQLFGGSDDEDGRDDKLRRAFKRSKDDEASSRKHCYFFSQEEPLSNRGKNTFPRTKATGRWKCLSQPDMRRRAFTMGLPYTFVAQGAVLPDELFQWILDEVCTEQNAELRRQYINLAELCEDNTNRLVDEARLYALLERAGGPKYAREPSRLKCTTEVRHDYLERNWSPLVAYLQLLDRIAPSLRAGSAISAIQLLLRMSMDPVVASVVCEHHTRAMTTLVSSLVRSRSQWNTACRAICSYVYENMDDIELKVTALLSIPSSTSHLVDLRRRLAAESLLDEPGLGSQPADASLSFERIRDRLDGDGFKGTNTADFDSERLRALTTLLDVAIGSADFIMRGPAATDTGRGAAGPRGGPHNEEEFDAAVDALAARVKAVHDRIRDKASRKNVKLGLLGLEKRLRYAVRTRPPPRREIFALEGGPRARPPDANAPRQRDFMRQWALKKAERRGEDDALEATEPPGGGGRRAAKDLPVAVG